MHGADHRAVLVSLFPQPEISEALKKNAFHHPLDFHPTLRMIEKVLFKVCNIQCSAQLVGRKIERKTNVIVKQDQIMIVKEVQAKAVLSVSKVYPYVINPYTGCQHGCSYCYARFMKRFTGHKEAWGEFVDVKINAPDLLLVEINKKRKGRVWISGVCDPYQPLEAKYKLTRECLKILAQHDWPVIIQTRSPLVLRDMDILKQATDLEVGLTVTTADESIRKSFEPNAPPIRDRIGALEKLHRAGIRTYAMIAPMLPGASGLAEALEGKVDYLLVDRMNYNYADWVYRKYNLKDKLTDDFFCRTGRELASKCGKLGIDCRVVF